jgi:hypothetical protein
MPSFKVNPGMFILPYAFKVIIIIKFFTTKCLVLHWPLRVWDEVELLETRMSKQMFSW